jgi:TetR/AcrR family transcriptional regulator, transcriptional repressor for nem operon
MGRPRTFEEGTVLASAMHAFRRHGYAGVSMTQLEQATGLSASSLYNTFDDKAGLHRRALEHYVRTFVLQRLVTYAGSDAGLEELEELFLTLFEPPLHDGYGCLVINTATEIGSHPGVDEALDAVARRISEVLERELGTSEDALLLVLLYQGLLVSERAGRLDHRYRQTIQNYFAGLRARRNEGTTP